MSAVYGPGWVDFLEIKVLSRCAFLVDCGLSES